MIPGNITREHVLKALREIDINGVPKGRDSRKFILLYEGKAFPPKYVVSLANKYANDIELDSSTFSGGKETNKFLMNLEFEILDKSTGKPLRPETKIRPKRIPAARARAEVRAEKPPKEPSLGAEDLGNFYHLISSFEREMRSFITEKLGKAWIKRLEHELPATVEKWRERQSADIKWGIIPEKEPINYADLTDYMQIIRKYDRIFAESDEELSAVRTKLKDFANYGRNPLMHCRTLDLKKYYATQAAVDYLREWIKRRT